MSLQIAPGGDKIISDHYFAVLVPRFQNLVLGPAQSGIISERSWHFMVSIDEPFTFSNLCFYRRADVINYFILKPLYDNTAVIQVFNNIINMLIREVTHGLSDVYLQNRCHGFDKVHKLINAIFSSGPSFSGKGVILTDALSDVHNFGFQ